MRACLHSLSAVALALALSISSVSAAAVNIRSVRAAHNRHARANNKGSGEFISVRLHCAHVTYTCVLS